MAVGVEGVGRVDDGLGHLRVAGTERARVVAEVAAQRPGAGPVRGYLGEHSERGRLGDTDPLYKQGEDLAHQQLAGWLGRQPSQPFRATHRGAAGRWFRAAVGGAGLTGLRVDDLDLDQVVRADLQDVAQRREGVHGQPLRRGGDQPVDLFPGQVHAPFGQERYQIRGLEHSPFGHPQPQMPDEAHGPGHGTSSCKRGCPARAWSISRLRNSSDTDVYKAVVAWWAWPTCCCTNSGGDPDSHQCAPQEWSTEGRTTPPAPPARPPVPGNATSQCPARAPTRRPVT